MAEEEKKQKKKRRRPDKSISELPNDEGMVHRINALHAALWDLPPVDLDDVEAVDERTKLFFTMCDMYGVKALWETYCFALGYCRSNISFIVQGKRNRPCRDIIVKARERLLSDLVQLMASGQTNPIPGIFLLKNNYGYSDKVEITTTTVDPTAEQRSIAEIKQRLIESVPQDDVVGEAHFVEVSTDGELAKELAKAPEN